MPPTPDRLVLEAASPLDLSVLLELEQLCFSHPWTRQHFQQALADTAGDRVLVLRTDAGICAYCVLAWAADELHVHNLAVHPGWRRQGLARWLLAQALSLGRRRGARVALLEVRAGNEAALRLYRDSGFRDVQVRRAYYREPPEDAVVLGKDLD